MVLSIFSSQFSILRNKSRKGYDIISDVNLCATTNIVTVMLNSGIWLGRSPEG
jgi:hypothetical protein